MIFTTYAKQRTAKMMFYMGIEFIQSALLLEKHGKKDYVSLHLICQGTELVLKSLLLYKDYDKFSKQVKNNIGHDLLKLAKVVIKEYGTKDLDQVTYEQIEALSKRYVKHELRYVSVLSNLGYYLQIETGFFFRKLKAVITLAKRTIFAHSPEDLERKISEDEIFVYRRGKG